MVTDASVQKKMREVKARKMTKLPRLGDYLTSHDVRDGDVVVIVEEPKRRSKEDTGFDRDVWGVKVQLPNKNQKDWTLNKTTYNTLWDEFGDNSANWLGKKVRISTEKRRVRGEMKTVLYGEPLQQGQKHHTSALENPTVSETT